MNNTDRLAVPRQGGMSIDPRAENREKIEPPHPLPYVSRRALRRVKDALPPPESCHNCGSMVRLVNNAEIYGREYGDWPYAYKCISCDSYVGLHPDTDLPLGTLADKATREARKAYKQAFINVQRREGWGRKQAYAWLAMRMGLPVSECHWGMFSVNQAELAGAICIEHMEEI